MTASLDALARLDDGLPLTEDDRNVLAVFDRHCAWRNAQLELRILSFDAGRCYCGAALPAGDRSGECVTCHNDIETAIERNVDV